MTGSLRRRLLAALFGAVLAAWLATAFFSYLDARRRIDAMLDAHLRQAAGLLFAAAEAPPQDAGAADGWVLAYRVQDAQGRLLRRSPGGPDLPPGDAPEGMSDAVQGGARWRVYAARDPVHGVSVQVAERYALRNALATDIARHLLHPLAIALPVLAALIWLSVGWGLAPLQRLARDLRRRGPEPLAPLDPGSVPQEIRPLVAALNALFDRVARLLERERRFTADAAHELRTPLAAIRAQAEAALGARDDEERMHAIGGVVAGTERAARLVEQLLALERLEAQDRPPSPGPVRLAEIAADCIAEAAPAAAERRVDLGLAEETDRDAAVAGDAALLAVLLRNLIDNAVRYSPRGGSVDVSVRREDGRVALRVADSGPGIAPAQRGRVLDRFYRIPGSGAEGSGLGLSIVRRIAEMHGASLGLDAGPDGRGLVATVRFPGRA